MIMSNSLNQNTGADILALEQLDAISGGRETVGIVGCTTRPPMGGYPRERSPSIPGSERFGSGSNLAVAT
jgi:hypothetical protein